MIVGSFSKLPSEKRDFLFDWASRLATTDGIATSSVVATGLTLTNKVIAGKTVTFFADGGMSGTSYVVTNSINTTAGLTLEAQMVIAVSNTAGLYATLSEADSYHAARGNALWMAGDLTAREAALFRAHDHIKFQYVASLLPNYDDTLDVVKLATIEAAALELGTPNLFTATYTPSQQKVLTQVGEIKWTPVDAKMTGFDAAMPISTKIEAMFKPFVSSNQSTFFGLRSIGG